MLETPRLNIRQLAVDDAAFILRLVNEPSWLRFIGDKGVRTEDGARDYLIRGPIAMYDRHGFGLWRVDLGSDGTPIGICGLIKCDSLADVDLGFALLPEHWGCGYAYEAATEVMAYGRATLGLERIVAISSPDNHPSIALLGKLGFRFERTLRLAGDDGERTSLFVHDPWVMGSE